MSDGCVVWVVNRSGHQYHKAARFGEVRFLTEGYLPVGYLDRLMFSVAEPLQQSNPDDFLLTSGLLSINVMAMAAWVARHGNIRLLLWDPKIQDYRKFVMDPDHLQSVADGFAHINDEAQVES